MDTLLFALWFFLPAGVANAAPILAAKTPLFSSLNARMDFGGTFRGKAVFGANKTWRGLASGIIAAVAVIYAQQLLFQDSDYSFLNVQHSQYLYESPVLLGILFGSGALLGDAIESFFKRQTNLQPGASWFPFDQIDYIIGGCLASLMVITLPLSVYATILAVWSLLHLLFSYVGYLLHMKPHPI
jgi:CDP-2,3-bis-(O-geranylgeranyl)-sn-glycerol synthase